MIERFHESTEYEHLYRRDIADGDQLVQEIEVYVSVFNQVRSHESLDLRVPVSVYLESRRECSIHHS